MTGRNEAPPEAGVVVAVHLSATHDFSKETREAITLIEGVGVDGDAHAGPTVKHRSRVRYNPATPNLRQVHLIHAELLDALAAKGFEVAPGALGENVTTRGVDLLGLPVGARLRLGADAVVTVAGLRNPCAQIEAFCPGLLGEVLTKDDDGTVRRLAGVMGTVSRGGVVRPGEPIAVELPPGRHYRLAQV